MAVEACMLLLVHLIVNPITKKIHWLVVRWYIYAQPILPLSRYSRKEKKDYINSFFSSLFSHMRFRSSSSFFDDRDGQKKMHSCLARWQQKENVNKKEKKRKTDAIFEFYGQFYPIINPNWTSKTFWEATAGVLSIFVKKIKIFLPPHRLPSI
jgi:hypothetical protein